MSKKLFAVLSLLVLAGMLVACGTTEVEETEVVVEPTEEVEVTEVVTEEPVPATTRVGGWLDQVAMSVVSADAAVTQISAGAIDLYAGGLATPQDLAAIEEAGLSRSDQFGLFYEITFNVAGPIFDGTGKLNPFSDQKIREAMNWLVDRNYINQEVYGGASVPKWVPVVAGFPDYPKFVDTIRPIEAYYAYDMEKAQTVIGEQMVALGAELVDGKWNYNGEPVTLIFLIRTDSDGTRVPIGDYVANQLEAIGFTVDRQYKTSSEASPLWVLGNCMDGLWHLYTGAWGSSAISRDDGNNFQFYYTTQSAYSFSDLWQRYVVPEELNAVSEALANATYTTLEERADYFEQALWGFVEQSFRIWLIDGKAFTPWQTNVSVAYDLSAGVDINALWPYTLRFIDQEGGTLKWGNSDLFVDPPNPVAGSNWTYDAQWQNATRDYGVIPNPFTGVPLPQRIERAEVTVLDTLPVTKTYDYVDLQVASEIAVPADAWIDWDPVAQTFIPAGDGVTAKVKSVVYYPENLFTITWHDGSPLTVADFVMLMIMTFDPGYEASAIYDEAQAAVVESFKSTFKGFRITSTDPLVIEYYTDTWFIDAEYNIYSMWPYYGYGEAPWHTIAIGNKADAALELAYSADKSDANEIEWMSFIAGPSLEILSAKLAEAAAESYIPYAPTMGTYVTAEEAAARYANLAAFYETYGHFWVGTGPYILDDVFSVEKTLTLTHNPNYIDLADKWAIFAEPMLAEVAVDGAGRVTIGEEATFDVFVTYKGEPYAGTDISFVKYMVFDAEGTLVLVGEAEFVADGQYLVTISAEDSAALAAGANKLEVAVAPIPVAIPSFGTFEFVTE
jgi:peptide/nickel transport system substrate-binding protein